MARETVPAASSAHADRSGRGLVVSGAIITAISLAITTVVAIYFVAGLVSSPQAMSIIFPFLLLSWLALAMPRGSPALCCSDQGVRCSAVEFEARL